MNVPFVVADIGGTNARFALARIEPNEAFGAHTPASLSQVHTLRVADFANLDAALAHYLTQAQHEARAAGASWSPPTQGVLAVASPVDGDRVSFINSPWSFSRATLQAQLGWTRLIVLNDFDALARSLPRLPSSALQAIGPTPFRSAATFDRNDWAAGDMLAVVGPGTGLGVGAIVKTPQGWQSLPGEGGHATLAAGDAFEAEVIAHARSLHPHVSAERLLSGTGLPTLHRCVRAAMSLAPGKDDDTDLTAAQIVERALGGGDADCDRTVDVFCGLLGSFCGNVALTYGARAGVFLGGGVLSRLGERFQRSGFRARFEAKGRYADYLNRIPTALITDTHAALRGASTALT